MTVMMMGCVLARKKSRSSSDDDTTRNQFRRCGIGLREMKQRRMRSGGKEERGRKEMSMKMN